MSEEKFDKRFHYVFFNFTGTIINAVLKFLTIIIIVRLLTVADFGVFNILLSILSVVSLIGSLGLEPIMERFIPEYHEKKNYHLMKKLIKNSVAIKFAAGLALAAAVIFFSPALSLAFQTNVQDFTFILGILIIVLLEVKLLDIVVLSLLDHKYRFLFNVASAASYLLLSYMLLVLGYGVNGVLIAYLVMNLVLFLGFFARTYLLILRKKHLGDKIPIFRRVFRYGLPMYMTGLGDIIFNVSLDNFLISFFLGTFFVGLYSFAFTIPQYLFVYSPALIAAPVVLPISIRKYIRTESSEQLNSSFKFYNKATAFFSIPLAVGTIILSHGIIEYIFGNEYLQAAEVFTFFIIIFAIWSFARPISIIIRVLERADIVIKGRIFILWNLIMDIILIPIVGIMGAAIATGTSILFLMLFQLYLIRRQITLSYPWKGFLIIIVNTIPMTLFILFVRTLIVDIFSLAAVIIIGIVIYFATSKLNKPFKNDTSIISQRTRLNIFRYF